MKYESDIRQIISDIITLSEPINTIDVETNIQNIGVTSLTFVQIIIEIERRFDLDFPEDKFVMSEAGTIAQLCKIVESIVG